MKFVTYAMALFSLTAFAETKGGNGVDNGGQQTALKFTKLGYETLVALKKLSPQDAVLQATELDRLELAIVHTRVHAIPGPFSDNSGRTVDARLVIDKGKQVIELDDAKWERLLGSSETVRQLVLHEYLRAMNLDDDNYKISARVNDEAVRNILSGKVLVNPDSTSQQTIFEQLGEFLRLGERPGHAFFTKDDHNFKWESYCFSQEAPDESIDVSLNMFSRVNDNGPLVPKTSYVRLYRHLLGSEQHEAFRIELNFVKMAAFQNALQMRTPQLLTDKPENRWTFLVAYKDYIILDSRLSSSSDSFVESDKAHGIVRCYFVKGAPLK